MCPPKLRRAAFPQRSLTPHDTYGNLPVYPEWRHCMRKPFAALFLFLLPLMAFAGQVRVESDIPGSPGGPTDTEVLQYDDGTPQWLTWGSTYRGVWFNPDDFLPDNNGFSLTMMEWWFYQSPGTPWDTDRISTPRSGLATRNGPTGASRQPDWDRRNARLYVLRPADS